MDTTAEKKYILAGSFIDGSGAAVQKKVCLTVSAGKITAIQPGAKSYIPADGVVVDLTHCTIMPPLVDSSITLTHSAATAGQPVNGGSPLKYADAVTLIRQNVHFCHSHGVLGAADNGNHTDYLRRFCREDATAGSMRIKISAHQKDTVGIKTEGASMVEGEFFRSLFSTDIEKLCETSHISLTDQQGADREINGAFLQTGKWIAVANGEQDVQEALRNGCQAIEQGFFMGDENLQRMAESGTVWIPTALKAKNGIERTRGRIRDSFKKALQNQMHQLKKAREYGVVVALGTGAGGSGILHGESVVEELKLFIKSGYSLVEALKCASFHGAAFFGINDVGLLQTGKAATFIVTRGMVQQLPRKLLYLEDIYVNGEPSRFYRKNPVKTVQRR